MRASRFGSSAMTSAINMPLLALTAAVSFATSPRWPALKASRSATRTSEILRAPSVLEGREICATHGKPTMILGASSTSLLRKARTIATWIAMPSSALTWKARWKIGITEFRNWKPEADRQKSGTRELVVRLLPFLVVYKVGSDVLHI